MNKPQQARSQKTYDNLLDAAIRLLDSKSFEEMTIADIVSGAGCSVGAFYGRFKDKDALLHALDARYVDRQLADGKAWIERVAGTGLPLAELVQDLIGMLYHSLSQDLGLLRTLILKARLYPDPRFREQEARLNAVVPQIVRTFLAHQDEIKHPDPPTAVSVGFMQAYLTLRETLAWQHIGQNFPLSGEQLVQELARSFNAYLQSP
jgi:AcrR family transcriptional regulator